MPRLVPIALLVLLPLVFVAGRRLAQHAVGERQLAALLAPGCALALWLLSIHLIGLATHSFWAGLVAGTLLPAALGAVLWRSSPVLAEGVPLGRGPLVAAALAGVVLL